MEQNSIRQDLANRLEIADLEYDIKRMSAEMDYHKSKTMIFEHTVQAQQADLDCLLGVPTDPRKMGEIYK
jgi:hypothetical protein